VPLKGIRAVFNYQPFTEPYKLTPIIFEFLIFKLHVHKQQTPA